MRLSPLLAGSRWTCRRHSAVPRQRVRIEVRDGGCGRASMGPVGPVGKSPRKRRQKAHRGWRKAHRGWRCVRQSPGGDLAAADEARFFPPPTRQCHVEPTANLGARFSARAPEKLRAGSARSEVGYALCFRPVVGNIRGGRNECEARAASSAHA
jgi:hypothetical protein